MKITDVEVAYLKIPSISEISNGTQDVAVVLVHTDEGITGIGEAETSPHVAKAVVDAPRSHSVMVGLKEVLVGENPLDIALWDIKGKAYGQPICNLLGGSTDAKVRAYASALFGKDGVETAEKAARFKEAGYTAFKFGWMNFGFHEKSDRAHVEGVRNAVGPDAPIMFDVGWAYDSGGPEWDHTTALRRANVFADYDIYWLEEPLHPDDWDGYRELCDRSPVRIAAGEQMATIGDFRDLVHRANLDVIQPDVARVGGITETMRIAAYCYAHRKPCVPHHFSTGILGAASIHVNASIPNSLFQETPAPGEGSILNTDLVTPGVQLDSEGNIVIPKAPGLGIELNKDVFDKYRVE